MRAHHAFPLLVLVAACGGDADPNLVQSELDRDLDPDVSSAELEQLVAGDTAFAADLYGAVKGEPGNLFFSPHSISTALAMTFAGAETVTEAEMAETLHFTLPEPALHAALNHLDLVLASRSVSSSSDVRPFRLTTANSIWGQDGADFQADFLDTLAVNYGAGLRVLDFAADPEGAREVINGWVEDRTEDKIQDLLPEGTVTDLTKLVLTNAIYFSAAWDEPFEAADTEPGTFTTPTGAVTVDTMHSVAEQGYGAGDGWEAAELAYDGGDLSMVIVVPSDVSTFALSSDVFAAVHASLVESNLTLALPKFSFDAPLSLKDVLADLGMPSAFSSDADFSGIDGSRALAITDVLHKGFIGIDEAGTEAAAATAVIVGDTAVPESHTLTVDRPFLFWIRDRPTGAILFVGRVLDPS